MKHKKEEYELQFKSTVKLLDTKIRMSRLSLKKELREFSKCGAAVFRQEMSGNEALA